jgi:repressor LexA
MDSATPRQRRILEFIQAFAEREGMPPTRAEIGAHFGIERASVQDHLRLMVRKGLVELAPGVSRGVRVHPQFRRRDPHGLPLLGRIAAGQPLLSDGNVEEQVPVDPGIFRPRADFLFRVQGHSMQDAHILDGDLVGIREQAEAQNHQIVAVAVGDAQTEELQLTLKRFHRQGPIITLRSENADQQRYAPIVVDTRQQALRIIGLYAGLLRMPR